MRYHSNHLQRFSETQAVPLTGVGNRRALEGVGSRDRLAETVRHAFLPGGRGHRPLQGPERPTGPPARRRGVAEPGGTARRHRAHGRYRGPLQRRRLRGGHAANRSGGRGTLAERLRGEVARTMPFSVSVGVATSGEADTPESLFQRADARCLARRATAAIARATIMVRPSSPWRRKSLYPCRSIRTARNPKRRV